MTAYIYTADNDDKCNNNIKKLKDLILDINNFIIIFNINTVILSRFLESHMAELSRPKTSYIDVSNDTELLLFRDSKTLLCPKEPDNDEELIRILKTSFRANLE
jgi:hypothetical protein